MSILRMDGLIAGRSVRKAFAALQHELSIGMWRMIASAFCAVQQRCFRSVTFLTVMTALAEWVRTREAL
nr:hypothetical protein [uncultured Aquabacterium sp.]